VPFGRNLQITTKQDQRAANQNKLSRFWQELKRRKVIKVLFMYAGAAIALLGLASDVTGLLNMPDWLIRPLRS